jgi:hypothetical protein
MGLAMYILGDFFTDLSGHPAAKQARLLLALQVFRIKMHLSVSAAKQFIFCL